MPVLRNPMLAIALALSLALGACNPKQDSASLLTSAKDYLAKSDVRAALIQLRNARQQAPNDAEIRFLLGRSLLEIGDAPAAEIELRKALELKYSPDEVIPLIAQAALNQGDFRKVVTEFAATGIGDAKARASLATSRAIAWLALGDMKQARSAMEAALAADPKNPRTHLVRAQLAVRSNDVLGAVAALDTALAGAPNDPEALVMKAELMAAQGRRDEGVRFLEQAVTSNPNSLHPRFALVSWRLAGRDVDKAQALVDEMTKIAPNDFRTVYSTALLALTKNEPTKARDLAQSLTAARPDHVPSMYLAALANYELKNWTTSEELLRKVISHAPDDPGPRRVLSAGLLRAGRTTAAVEATDAALRRIPDDAILLRLAGEARVMSGRAGEATRFYERAAAMDKNNKASQLRLAQIRLATGETGRALGDLERLAQTDPSNIQADISLYAAHLRRREFDKALAAVASIEKKQPKTAMARELRGIVYSAQRKTKEARQEYVAALELDPKRVSTARSLALLDLLEGKPAEARARYEKMAAADPKNDQPLLGLAEIQALSGAPPAEVRATIERAIAVNPNSPGPRLALVVHHRRIGDLKGALEAARAAATALPADPQIVELHGAMLLANGDIPLARDTFTRLAQLLPNSAVPLLRLSEANVAARDFASALDAQRKALALQPDHAPTLIAIATTYLLSGKPQEAINEARRLQRDKPKEGLGYALEGEILAAQKKFSEAAVVNREALQRQPSAGLAARQYVLLTLADKTSDANAFADRWVKEHPKDAQFLSLLGQQRQARKDIAGATSAYRAALEVDADNVVVLNNYAWILNEQGKPEARDLAERAYRLAPLQPNVVDTYAAVLMRQGETARALTLSRMAINLQPNDPRLRLNLAHWLAKSGDKAGARRELEEVVKNPRSPLKAEAEQLLREL
ncbi:MAG TPA: XrtA/PEP-CTERM system TPR-repeat protein PrsT [Casimicrobiaceae bacterium]|nr:XrtA/PEP-CTERM system TPR-repeat protein PrsT [Casimicrobiaceae bacterium]